MSNIFKKLNEIKPGPGPGSEDDTKKLDKISDELGFTSRESKERQDNHLHIATTNKIANRFKAFGKQYRYTYSEALEALLDYCETGKDPKI